MQTNIQSETQKTFRNVLRTETVSLSRHGGWDRRAARRLLHIQLVIYESCTHATHLLITILLMKAPEAAFPPPPISIFVPVDFFPPLNVTPRRLLKCEKILISLIRSHRPSSLCDVLDSDECSVDVQPSLLSANSMLFTGDGEARNLHVSDVML